jgi:chromosome partitioning protein
MFDRRLNLASQVVQEAQDYFGEKVYKTIIPRNVKLSESPSFGKPILLYDVQCTGAKSYLELAREVIGRA